MVQPEQMGYDPRQNAEQLAAMYKEVIDATMTIAGGDPILQSPIDFFPSAKTIRAEDRGISYSPEQEAGIRGHLARLGFGQQTDRSPAELGMEGGHHVIEGGLAHKVIAEANLALSSADKPQTLILCGVPAEDMTGAAATASAKKHLRRGVSNGYDVALGVAEVLPGFHRFEKPVVLAMSYEMDDAYTVGSKTSEQFVQVGTIGSTNVVVMRIDRIDTPDGSQEFRQPSAGAIVRITDRILNNHNDSDSPIALITSGTYRGSREASVVEASLSIARPVGVASYGTHRLAKVKGEDPVAPDVKQIPGELHELARRTQLLKDLLARTK